MDFSFTQDQIEFRKEIRKFLKTELEQGSFSVQSNSLTGEASIDFTKKMAEKGWIGITWAKRYGGQERSYIDKMILTEEMCRVHAPIGHHFMGDRQVGPALIEFGTEFQKEYFLPRIINANPDTSFCLLFSEPDAGSDLASITTAAIEHDKYYLVNGQKVWTSFAENSGWGWLLAKTGFDEKKPPYEQCSEFILDLKTPGVVVRSIKNIANSHDFNEVFLDNVKIKKKFLVGKKNDGFKQIMAQVDYERAGIERLMQNYPVYTELVNYIKNIQYEEKNSSYYQWLIDQMAQIEIEFNAGRLLCYSTAWAIDQGQTVTSKAALCKAFCTQYEQRLNDLATRVMGPISLLRNPTELSPLSIDIAESYLYGPSYTIQGGTVEILKQIVAQRGLGMPRK